MVSSFGGFSAYFQTGHGLGFFFFVFFDLLIDGFKFQNRCLILKGQSLIFIFIFNFMKNLKILCNLTESTKLTQKLRRVNRVKPIPSRVRALYCIWYQSHRGRCWGGYDSVESYRTRPILWTLIWNILWHSPPPKLQMSSSRLPPETAQYAPGTTIVHLLTPN